MGIRGGLFRQLYLGQLGFLTHKETTYFYRNS